IDYLLKPISKERFAEALARARDLLHEEKGLEETIGRIAELVQPAAINRLPVAKGKRIVLLNPTDVMWIEASDELVFVHTKEDRYLINMTMTELEQRLDARTFFRTHRSSIVNLDHVVEIVPWFGGKYKVVVDDDEKTEVVLSRARARRLRDILPW
ncbi:response regulator transcription factor, partial [bacterium]|nr:response regulator transcription factor [bacterium]